MKIKKHKGKIYTHFRKKIFMVLVCISVIPLSGMFLSTAQTVILARVQTISDLQSQAMHIVQEKVSGFIDEKLDAFNVVVDVNPSDISEIQKESLDFLMNGVKESARDVVEISFINLQGQEVVKSSEYGAVSFAVLRNVAYQRDFIEAVSGKRYIGDVQYSLSGPIVRVASQIENHDRQIIGVISAEISLRRLQGLIGRVQLGMAGFVYLLDREGNLMTTSDATFARIGTNLRQYSLVSDVLQGTAHNGMSSNDRYINIAGERVIVSGQRFANLGNWSVFAEWPEQDALGVMNTLLARAMIVLIIGLLLVVLFSYIIARAVVKPIDQLIEATDAISMGNLNYEVRIKTGDELEKLAEHFKSMSHILKENKKLKDEFVFIAAHELRAPVTAIRGYLSMLIDKTAGMVDESAMKIIETVNTANQRLVQLVHDLLQIARSDAGKMEIRVHPIFLRECVIAVCKELDPLAKEKKIALVYDTSGKDVLVRADADKLKEVLVNLVGNAIKYTQASGGDITIEYTIQGTEVITFVKDHGIGVTREDMALLFSKFYRAKNEYTERIEGTGLGLFICKEIVERMGGKIWVTSDYGQGSIFSFSLRKG